MQRAAEAVHLLGRIATYKGSGEQYVTKELTATVLEHLKTAVKDADPQVRLKAVEELGDFGDRAMPLLPELTTALNDADPTVRIAASVAVLQVDPTATDAVNSVLNETLSTAGSLADNWEAFEALIRARTPAAAAAVPGLTAMLKSSDPIEHTAPSVALASIGPPAKKALPRSRRTSLAVARVHHQTRSRSTAVHGVLREKSSRCVTWPRRRPRGSKASTSARSRPPAPCLFRIPLAPREPDDPPLSPWIASALVEVATSPSIDLTIRKNARRSVSRHSSPRAFAPRQWPG